MAFQPKQIIKYQAEELNELQGDVSQQAINFSLKIIPPFRVGDVIHDNACGSGAITESIMALNPPDIHIEATDINEQFTQGVAAIAADKSWPVTTANMPAQKLTFPDENFNLSFTNFAFHCLGDHDSAAAQIYRSLKPGGSAMASIWTFMPHVDALQHAHWRTRGKYGPMPTLLPLEGFKEPDLLKTLELGGFKPDNISCQNVECHLRVPDLKRWAQLAWSYLGHTPSGWSPSDEDKWDEAIEDIVEQLHSGDGISHNDKGETVMRMIACIGVAKK
ncbi:S-adenosyl-L-methionine-dependent methyltransferase [Diaporthe sp. PMI_573]|nr:S-adenosyl-L-methionine-dependent methyltransferase [Diaporthaceae sp. PMI_573]